MLLIQNQSQRLHEITKRSNKLYLLRALYQQLELT
jgi:hypothetical protein